MGASVTTSNDTKKVQSNMKELSNGLGDVTAGVKSIQKAQQAILKDPDKCKDSYKQLAGLVGGLADVVKDMDKLVKDTGKAIVN